jgi:hypothetical protein
MQRFSQGSNLFQDTPALAFAVARIAMAPLSERAVERKHRLMSMETSRAYHSGAPSLSLRERMPEVQQLLSKKPEFLTELSNWCSRVYHPVAALRTLGLASHPDILRARGNGALLGTSREHAAIAKSVVYHIDLHSQHLVVAFNIPPAPPTGGNGRVAAPEPDVPEFMMPPSSADPEPAEPSDVIFEKVLSRAGVDTFLKSVKPGSFFPCRKCPFGRRTYAA